MPSADVPAAPLPPASYPNETHVSPHLTWAELACHDGTPYPREWLDRAIVLAAEFEVIREYCGNHPLCVLSGYRTAAYNARCGGAPHSQHVEGRALDLQVRAGWTEDHFFSVVRAAALRTDENGRRVGKIRGIGRYPTRGFVHVDIRPEARLTVFAGAKGHYIPHLV